MRRRGRWMNKATEPVLEVLNDSGDWRSASDIIVNINEQFADPPSKRTVYRALKDLLNYRYDGPAETQSVQLIEKREFETFGEYYCITELGERYLAGEIDGGNLSPPE